ncbi:expressed unknown protein [Seminavis robusta]|uniref:Uncharacterized protein n=1 Tax=Seminavis robusta TaxID=568900 RepID=A0A9N8HQK7_9STRA|nr:expressed unknown protein [Seminavis robusta]|eukprot:Sro1298_g260600.1 n/a (239) ;mRNA; f:13189-13905
MIKVPAAPSTNRMNCTTEEWPSLGTPQVNTPSEVADKGGDDWEMLSPSDSGQMGENGEEVVLSIPRPLKKGLTRKNSASAPDLRVLDGEEDYSLLDAQTHLSSSVVVVPSVAASSDAKNPWLNKNKVSFKDAILTPSKYVPSEKTKTTAAIPRAKNKVKSRYVVTPIKRCAKSTGDLLALAEQEMDEILGESDAQEYYQRKSHGAHGRTNGMKQRPDEAKRKDMIVQKKNMQRQQQGR